MSVISKLSDVIKLMGADIKSLLSAKADKADLGSAASHNVGLERDQIPKMENEGLGGYGYAGICKRIFNSANDEINTGFYRGSSLEGMPDDGFYFIQQFSHSSEHRIQIIQAIRHDSVINYRCRNSVGWGNTHTIYSDVNTFVDTNGFITKTVNKIHDTTTAEGANVVVSPTGELMRSTSSERYKQILAPLVLSDKFYERSMQLEPIIYRSLADADNHYYHYFSFSAEQVANLDPALAYWRSTEQIKTTVTDDDGIETTTTETVKLDKPIPEGLNINGLLAAQHAISVYQHKTITAQGEEIKLLSEKIEKLEEKLIKLENKIS